MVLLLLLLLLSLLLENAMINQCSQLGSIVQRVEPANENRDDPQIGKVKLLKKRKLIFNRVLLHVRNTINSKGGGAEN